MHTTQAEHDTLKHETSATLTSHKASPLMVIHHLASSSPWNPTYKSEGLEEELDSLLDKFEGPGVNNEV